MTFPVMRHHQLWAAVTGGAAQGNRPPALAPELEAFEANLRSMTSGLSVDFDHLDELSRCLDGLAEVVSGEVAPRARLADRPLRAGRYGNAFGDNRIPEVLALGQRTHDMSEAVRADLVRIATALTETARAVQRIKARYARGEELARLSLAEVGQQSPQSTVARE